MNIPLTITPVDENPIFPTFQYEPSESGDINNCDKLNFSYGLCLGNYTIDNPEIEFITDYEKRYFKGLQLVRPAYNVTSEQKRQFYLYCRSILAKQSNFIIHMFKTPVNIYDWCSDIRNTSEDVYIYNIENSNYVDGLLLNNEFQDYWGRHIYSRFLDYATEREEFALKQQKIKKEFDECKPFNFDIFNYWQSSCKGIKNIINRMLIFEKLKELTKAHYMYKFPKPILINGLRNYHDDLTILNGSFETIIICADGRYWYIGFKSIEKVIIGNDTGLIDSLLYKKYREIDKYAFYRSIASNNNDDTYDDSDAFLYMTNIIN